MFKNRSTTGTFSKKHNTKSNCHEVCAYSAVVKLTHIARRTPFKHTYTYCPYAKDHCFSFYA